MLYYTRKHCNEYEKFSFVEKLLERKNEKQVTQELNRICGLAMVKISRINDLRNEVQDIRIDKTEGIWWVKRWTPALSNKVTGMSTHHPVWIKIKITKETTKMKEVRHAFLTNSLYEEFVRNDENVIPFTWND